MSSHPKAEDLAGLVRGTLSRAEARSVVRHLLAGCPTCQAAVAQAGAGLLGGQGRSLSSRDTEAAYDRAAERALAAALLDGRQLRRRKLVIHEALDRLAREGREGVEGFRDFPLELWGLAAYEALLERSWALRHEDPAQMVALAQLANLAASRLSVERHGQRHIMDLECRATVELANAYRVANRFTEAQSAVERAAALFLDGTEDQLLRARFFVIQGNINGDRRRLGAAFKEFETAHRIYEREGAAHLDSRVLISKALYTGYAKDPERAISLLRQGLARCDVKRDPQLARAVNIDIAWFSVVSGRLQEAREMVRQQRSGFEDAGKQEILCLRWTEALIHAALEEFANAERTLVEVRQELLDSGTPSRAAILSLDLASVWMSQGKQDQARRLALDAARTFLELNRLGPAGLALAMPFRANFKFRLATQALLAHVVQTLGSEDVPPTSPAAPP